MKKNITFFALLLVLFSCKKELSETQSNPNEMKASSVRTGGSQYTYLTVEVVNDVNSIASKIQSDVSRLYVDGVENVRAEFQHSNGDFYMMSNTLTTKTAKRFFKFPGNGCLENKNDYRIRIKDPNDVIAIQDITEAQGPVTMVMRLWSFNNKGVKLFDIYFNPEPPGSGSERVTVTKKGLSDDGITPDERWEVVPETTSASAVIDPPCTGTSKTQSVPFKFILRKKQ